MAVKTDPAATATKADQAVARMIARGQAGGRRQKKNAKGATDPAKERKLSDNLMFQVVVDCKDETDQATLMARLKAEDRKCRPLTL